MHYGLRILYLGLIVIPNTLLGAGITFSGDVIYSAYGEVEQPFNISLKTDQEIGGAILWIAGDMDECGRGGSGDGDVVHPGGSQEPGAYRSR